MPQDDKGPGPVRFIIVNSEEVAPPAEPEKAAGGAAAASAGKPAQTKAPPAGDDGGGDGERVGFNVKLPDDCPVTPLGEDGRTCYYLDAGMHLWELGAHEHNRLHIMRMFGNATDFLYREWPRKTQDKKTGMWHVTGWKPEGAAEALSAACSRLGDWDAAKKVRGAGAWKGDDGRLILHVGDAILIGAEHHKPGFIGGFVYPARPALPRPWPHPVPDGDGGPGAFLMGLFRCWHWLRGDLDARLLLGSIVCGMIGGALKWRPMPWITGDSGTGKSTLKAVIEGIYGGRLIACEDPSPAGIWQSLGHATLPIAIDEHEPEEQEYSRGRTQAVIKLARMAASGALMLRGGADHKSTEFVIRSCFTFFSVLIPALLPQDRNRIAILSLGPLRKEAAPEPEPVKLREAGQKLLRRAVDHWHRWPEVHAIFHGALMSEGLNSRTADVFAGLLTAAELVCSDSSDGLGEYARTTALEIAAYTLGEIGDDSPDQSRCLDYLLASMIPLDPGAAKAPVLEYIRRILLGVPGSDTIRQARLTLSAVGLKIVWAHTREKSIPFLAVAAKHKELNKLFQGSHWAARSGTTGVWKQSLLRLPGAEKPRPALWFLGGNSQAILLPMRVLFPPNDKTPKGQDYDVAAAVAAFESDAVKLEAEDDNGA